MAVVKIGWLVEVQSLQCTAYEAWEDHMWWRLLVQTIVSPHNHQTLGSQRMSFPEVKRSVYLRSNSLIRSNKRQRSAMQFFKSAFLFVVAFTSAALAAPGVENKVSSDSDYQGAAAPAQAPLSAAQANVTSS